jgi:hypothetical protein
MEKKDIFIDAERRFSSKSQRRWIIDAEKKDIFSVDDDKMQVQNAAVMAVTSAATAVIAATVGVVAHCLLTLDGRSFRNPIRRLYSYRNDTWETVQADPLYEGWFRANLRCSKATFEIIATRIEGKWMSVHGPLHWNTHFQIRDRVAVCIHYLCHSDGLRMYPERRVSLSRGHF